MPSSRKPAKAKPAASSKKSTSKKSSAASKPSSSPKSSPTPKTSPAPKSSPAPASPVLSGPVFGEDDVSAAQVAPAMPDRQQVDAVYNQVSALQRTQVVSFPQARGADGDLYSFGAFGARGAQMAAAIKAAGRVVFHMAGDSGASEGAKYRNETSVADHLVADCESSPANDSPSFLYHLGDLVYDFGESKYWFSQFYEPFRHYPRPIFALAGNHDSFVVPGTPAGAEPLTTFQRNFCAPGFAITPEAASLHRTAMTQPGLYFALDVPYARIIGLFSNALENPGVISSETSGQTAKWPKVPDYQLDFLEAQLQAIADSKYAGAVVLAVHHTPFSYSADGTAHAGCSKDMLRQIDQICLKTGVYPHAFVSGHAHNQQRFTRELTFQGKPYQVPFVVCGCSGHNLTPVVRGEKGQPAQPPAPHASVAYLDQAPAVQATDLLFDGYNQTEYGFLRVSADAARLTIEFRTVAAAGAAPAVADSVTVDLKSHRLA